MLGFAPIGRLAIGQLPSQNTPVSLTATMRVGASARSAISGSASIPGKMSVKAGTRVTPGVNLASRLLAQVAAKAISGVVLPGRIAIQTREIVTPGVNLASRLSAGSSLRALGGVALPGRITVAARSRVVPGVSFKTSISARVTLRAPGGVLIPSRISIRVKGYADKFFVPGSGHSNLPWIPQPAYEVKRAKPFRPIWDRLRQQQLEDARRKAAEPPPPPPLPPRSIFPAIVTLKLDTQLDHLARLVPGDWRQLERSVHEAEDATDAEFVLRAVVEAYVSDVADAFSAIQRTADQMLATALQEAAKPQPPKQIEIAIPPHSGTRSYHEQMQDVTDHADAMAALREGGIIPGEA